MKQNHNMTTIAIGNDHAGFLHKTEICSFLKRKNYEIINLGSNTNSSVDYPDYAYAVSKAVISGAAQYGILLCGSGQGVNIVANKNEDIRAALCWDTIIATLSRKHNDANVLCLPAKFLSTEEIKEIVLSFLDTEFEGGRHQKRINKIKSDIIFSK